MTGASAPAAYDAVVLYYRAGGEVLSRTLDALRAQSQPPRLIVVVDNDSADGVIPALTESEGTTILVLQENAGYAGGMNAGLAALPDGSSHVLFVTHEAELLPGAAAALLGGACETSSAIAGPRLLRRSDGSVWSHGGELLRSGGVLPRRYPAAAGPYDVDWLDGAVLLVVRSALQNSGGFDERFFLYWEDVELALRLRECGRIIAVPEAVAIQESGTTPPYFNARGRVLLWRKRREWRRLATAVAGELRRSLADIAAGRRSDGAGRAQGVVDGLTGRLHIDAAANWAGRVTRTASIELPHLVSFSLVVPFDGIPHAGGEYYLRHVRALVASGWHVTIVAPAFAPSLAAEVDEGVDAVAIPIRGLERRWGVGGRLRKARLTGGYRRRVLRDSRVRALVGAADVLEFQWTEMSSLARPLRRRVPGTARVAVAHDVVAQSLQRFAELRGAPLHLRLLRRARLVLGRRDEARQLNAVDAVITFSEKDANLLRQLGVRSAIEVVPPALQPIDVRWTESRETAAGRVLLVAAFNRKENVSGFLWFLETVWPSVRAGCSTAHLHVVGAEPTQEMREAAAAAEGVTVLGYVRDLVPEYQRAQVAVVPLLAGAGVKFKTVTAMLWGVPVVTTSVGAEGVAPYEDWASLFAAVADEPSLFASAVIETLRGGDGARRASAARRFAEARFGGDAFERRLAGIYSITAGTSTEDRRHAEG